MREFFHRRREKHHRLPLHCYRGHVVVAFHVSVSKHRPIFAKAATVDVVRGMLRTAMEKHLCAVVAYCFMPDHVHLVVRGTSPEADAWAAMCEWKGVSGRWLAGNLGAVWQKDFYDEVLTIEEAVEDTVRYVLSNPVEGGLVKEEEEYPFAGRGL
jgi:REP element-mobilizing transposase RayT